MNKKTNIERLIERLIEAKAETIKLGMDVHAREVVVCVQVDGSMAQRAQKLQGWEVEALVRGLVRAGCKVYSCYEAGPCGYGFHRQLEQAGATNYVLAPQILIDGRQQKTDGLDARALADQLDRYLRGNRRAFTVVRVPSEAEENRREEARLREQLKHSRHQWEARGRSLLLFKGYVVSGAWWQPRRWEVLQPQLPEWLVGELAVMRTLIMQLDEQEKARRQALESTAPQVRPKAVGALTWVLLSREVCDWGRFQNRRAVSSFTGLCPGVHQTGRRKRDGSINRHGNARVRALLIELVWRLVRWQPHYPPIQALVARVCRGAARRKCAVAAARRLAVDLWRLATGRTTPEKLGLIVLPPA